MKELTKDGITLQFDLRKVGRDLLILVTGGETHIGAVMEVGIGGSSCIIVPGHKDDLAIRGIAERASALTGREVVVVGGIHYDNIRLEEIKTVLELCRQAENLLEEWIAELG